VVSAPSDPSPLIPIIWTSQQIEIGGWPLTFWSAA
jgi:hypothetical protein